MISILMRFFRDETATASIDYVIVAGLVSIMIIVGATHIGTQTSANFSNAASAM